MPDIDLAITDLIEPGSPTLVLRADAEKLSGETGSVLRRKKPVCLFEGNKPRYPQTCLIIS